MKERPKAHIHLEYLQKNTYERLGLLDRFETFRKARSQSPLGLVDAFIQRRTDYNILSPQEVHDLRVALIEYWERQINADLPTPFEDPAHYPILQDLAKKIEEAADDL